jgi:hypothetical protein
MKPVVKELIVKNVLLIVAFILLYGYVQSQVLPVKEDPVLLQAFLISVSMIILCAMFGCFSFRYKDTAKGKIWLAHLVTATFMFGTGILFEVLAVLINVQLFTAMSVVIYLGLALYDFWDLYQMGG